MKTRTIKILPMLVEPEPSASPVAALYFALMVTACVTAALAALFESL